MFASDGQPEMVFSRAGLVYVNGIQRSKALPPLNDAQSEALDCIQFTAEKFKLEIKWQKGDMLFFNNRKLLHARNRFVDGNSAGGTRHFLRLWLRDEELAGLAPEELRRHWDYIFGPESCRAGQEDKWPLDPVLKGEVIHREKS
jgi:hypothetical protein